MKPNLLPLFLLALAGCSFDTTSQTEQIEATPDAPVSEIKRDTVLDKYIARPEKAYRWSKNPQSTTGADGGALNLFLTSQTWQGKPWEHRLEIFQPEKLRHADTAILNISFGSGTFEETFAGHALANGTGMTVVNVFNVPNQPLFGKTEDELIAYTFGRYLETGDEDWPLLFPMTKSVTKAMDALQEWSSKEAGGQINKFIVSGASKRGWTADLVAAADSRVIGAIPIVYNNLNLVAQVDHQREVWRNISPMMAPYANVGLFDEPRPENVKKLAAMVDPWTYRDRLTMPKLLINSTNDAYWPHNATKLYLKELPGQTDLFTLPNAPHVLADSTVAAIGSAAAWSTLVAQGKKAPTADLKVEKVGDRYTFSLTSDGKPSSVKLWIAASPSTDFRQARWKAVTMELRDGAYRVTLVAEKLLPPGTKHAAAFGEIEIAWQPLPLRLSSDMWESE